MWPLARRRNLEPGEKSIQETCPPPPWLPSGEVRGGAGLRHCSVLASFLSSAEPFCTQCPHV